ncbi:MAG: HAD-IIIC family phosphatase [Pseudomonadota bacterium]
MTAVESPDRDGIAVAIVSYRTAGMVIDAVPALLAELERLEGAHHHVYLVDNASPGADAQSLAAAIEARGWRDRVTLIASPVNGGFAAGNNLAFRAIRGATASGTRPAPEAVLLHNPDARVEPGALAAMQRLMHAVPRAGFIGPRLTHPDGSSWPGAFRFPSAGSEIAASLGFGPLVRRFPTVIEGLVAPSRVDWVTGTATLIRGEAWEALGDMDEGYFLYYEEVDYQRRGADLGWEAWHLPEARFAHEAGSATGITDGQARAGRTPAYRFEAWARYFSRNYGALAARAIAAARIAAMALGGLQRRLRGRRPDFDATFIGDFARHVLFARLAPPPASRLAWAQSAEGGHAGTGVRAPSLGAAEPDDGASDAFRAAEARFAVPPVAERGRRNDNPPGLSFWALVAEDFRTHERKILEQGFWAVFTSRFGNWRMDQPKLVRAPATLLYLLMFKLVEVFGGISLWYTVKLGRRVRIWHHGGIVLGCRAIGNDVQIRQNTTIGVGQTGRNAALPIIGNRVDIGAGAVIGGAVYVGDDAKIGGNALVMTDIPEGATVMGNPAQVVARAKPAAAEASADASTVPTAAPGQAVATTAPLGHPFEATDPELADETPMLATVRQMGRIALLGSANLDYLAMSFEEAARRIGLAVEPVVPPFGTARMALLDEDSDLRTRMAEGTAASLVAERAEEVLGDLLANPLALPAAERDAAVVAALEPLLGLVESAREALTGPILVLRLARFSRSPLGLADTALGPEGTPLGATDLVARANAMLEAAVADMADVHLIDTDALIAEVGLDAAAPAGFWHMGRVPFGEAFAARLARRALGALLALRGQTVRLLVLDLDDTLWGGVIGEEGIEGVALGGSYPGTAYQTFQATIRALATRGIALAIASKNDEDVAMRMVTEHPEMVLTPDDFVAHRIDWNEKSQNVAAMLDELGLGEASMMFIDDNAVERAKMRKNLPAAIVPEFPKAPEALAGWLLDNPFLETLTLTASDLKRTAQYRVRGRVNAGRRNFESVEDFYRDLGMKLRFEPFGEMTRQRVLQLLVKTNQFNTTTRRHDAAAVERILAEGGEVYAVGYEDRHAAPELMGVLALRPDAAMAAAYAEEPTVTAGSEDGALWVDSFVLSCRVLGRTVEHAIAAWASARAAALGAPVLLAPVIETPRNTPCRGVFAASGFARVDIADAGEGGLYRRDLAADGPAPMPAYFEIEGPEAAPAALPFSLTPTAAAAAVRSGDCRRDGAQAPAPTASPSEGAASAPPPSADPALDGLFRRIFRLGPDEPLEEASMESVARWDSLGHLKLAMEIERRLAIRIPGEVLGDIRTYPALAAAVAAERARAA